MANEIIDVTPITAAAVSPNVTTTQIVTGQISSGATVTANIPTQINQANIVRYQMLPDGRQVPVYAAQPGGSGQPGCGGCAAKKAAAEAVRQAALQAPPPVQTIIAPAVTQENLAQTLYSQTLTNERVAAMPGQPFTITAPQSIYNTTPGVVEPQAIALNSKVKILWNSVGFGRLGIGRATGYGGTIIPPQSLNGWNFISIHAPSAALIINEVPIRICGFFNTGSQPKGSVTFWASGNYLGSIEKPGITTDDKYGPFVLPAGENLLEVSLDGTSNASCHSMFAWKEVE